MRTISIAITLAGLFVAPMKPAVAQKAAARPPEAIPLSKLKPDLSPLKKWGTRVYRITVGQVDDEADDSKRTLIGGFVLSTHLDNDIVRFHDRMLLSFWTPPKLATVNAVCRANSVLTPLRVESKWTYPTASTTYSVTASLDDDVKTLTIRPTSESVRGQFPEPKKMAWSPESTIELANIRIISLLPAKQGASYWWKSVRLQFGKLRSSNVVARCVGIDKITVEAKKYDCTRFDIVLGEGESAKRAIAWRDSRGALVRFQFPHGFGITADLIPQKVGQWSRPVDGLRVRLVAPKPVYQVGEDLILRLEFQNVGKRVLSIGEPEFLPMISQPGDHPFEKDHDFTLVLSAEPIGHKIDILWARQQVQNRLQEQIRLPPDGVLSVDVRGRVGLEQQQEEILSDVQELRRAKDLPMHVERLIELPFAYRDTSGKFRLTAQYETTGRKRIGNATLVFPPIEIDIQPRSQSNTQD